MWIQYAFIALTFNAWALHTYITHSVVRGLPISGYNVKLCTDLFEDVKSSKPMKPQFGRPS